MDTNHIISIQWPVVFFLWAISVLIYRTSGFKEFKFFAWGWGFNLIYLSLNVLFAKRMAEAGPMAAIVLTNLTSSIFFLLTVRNNTIDFKNIIPLNRVKLPLIIGLFGGVIASKLFPAFTKTDYLQSINGSNLLPCVIDIVVFASLAAYFRALSKKSTIAGSFKFGHLVVIGFCLYAGIQVMSILPKESNFVGYSFDPGMTGFAVGLISKGLIFFGLINFLPTKQEFSHRRIVAHKLDDILGKTFHEIRYPLKSMNADLVRLLPENSEQAVTNKNEILDLVRQIDSSFNHLVSIIGASYKLYETDIGKPMGDQFDNITLTNNRLETVSVNTIIQIAILKTKPLTDEKVDFKCEFASNCYIDCYSYMIVQLFQNLFNNAFEALPDRSGLIKVRTRVKTQDTGLESTGKAIEVIVEDSGPGIPTELIEKVFEAGFSTKFSGKKRGFGLSIVSDIVNASGGKISISNNGNSSNGAKFILIFPQAKIYPKRVQ